MKYDSITNEREAQAIISSYYRINKLDVEILDRPDLQIKTLDIGVEVTYAIPSRYAERHNFEIKNAGKTVEEIGNKKTTSGSS